MKNTSDAGIYLVRHAQTDMVYVGQSVRINKRWQEHLRRLAAGSHHNKGLQRLWNQTGIESFTLEPCSPAPQGLSPLQLQRWLVKEERKYHELLKTSGLILNEADPEIVATAEAAKEYQRERIATKKAHDKAVSEKRRELKAKMRSLEAEIDPELRRLRRLEHEFHLKQETIKKATGWRRLFYGRPPGFNLRTEKECLQTLVTEINELSPKVNIFLNQIQLRKAEYQRLYSEFTKVADRRPRRTLSYGFLGMFNYAPPRIAE